MNPHSGELTADMHATQTWAPSDREVAIVEVLGHTQQLLDAITAADWKTYVELTDATLTCFEPEAAGQLVEGLDFHRYYFDLGGTASPCRTTMASPNVRILGNVAVIAYVRLTQKLDFDKRPFTTAVEETRIWHKMDGKWRQVHFHRSPSREAR